MQLSDHQTEILDKIIYANGRHASLAGLAGTGKTTIAKAAYDRWHSGGKHVVVMAPTGKASQVLRTKGVPAKTIHSVIYHFRGEYLDKNGKPRLSFEEKDDVGHADQFIVDEASMVTARQRKDIEAHGVPVLWVGDPGQLPPVQSKSSGVLAKPTHVLREIHRQAAESPVIHWAYALRKGRAICEAFEGIDHVQLNGRRAWFIAREFVNRKIDRMITKTNRQRVLLNSAIRQEQGRSGLLVAGDEIICCQNNKVVDVINGEIFTVHEVLRQSDRAIVVTARSHDTGTVRTLSLLKEQFGSEQKIPSNAVPERHLVLADYAYAITCHKFQGSSARHIGITPKGWCGGEERKWNYTAATRAEEQITVFC